MTYFDGVNSKTETELLEEFRLFAIATYPSLQNDWNRMEQKAQTPTEKEKP